jgi:hypothetical protein
MSCRKPALKKQRDGVLIEESRIVNLARRNRADIRATVERFFSSIVRKSFAIRQGQHGYRPAAFGNRPEMTPPT